MLEKTLCTSIKAKIILRRPFDERELEFLKKVTAAYALLGLGWQAMNIIDDMKYHGLIALNDEPEALLKYKLEALGTVSSAYKKLAIKYHPDRMPSPDQAEKFTDISSANTLITTYFIEILCTPTRDLLTAATTKRSSFSSEEEEPENPLIKDLQDKNREFLGEFYLVIPTSTEAFFGINKTPAWQKRARELRSKAYGKLLEGIKNLDHDEKLKIFEEALKLPLFTYHRHNFFFTGAYGRTSTQKQLERMYKKEKSVIDDSDDSAYEMKGQTF